MNDLGRPMVRSHAMTHWMWLNPMGQKSFPNIDIKNDNKISDKTRFFYWHRSSYLTNHGKKKTFLGFSWHLVTLYYVSGFSPFVYMGTISIQKLWKFSLIYVDKSKVESHHWRYLWRYIILKCFVSKMKLIIFLASTNATAWCNGRGE